METKNIKSGFVNIIGLPNAGKSTLMNELLGERLSIITHKAQTTRHRINGIFNDDGHQIIFSDTPGVIEPKYKLQEGMMSFVNQALSDADLFLIVVDSGEKTRLSDDLIKKLGTETPVIVVLNKMDIVDQTVLTQHFETWTSLIPRAKVVPISAVEKFYTRELLDMIKEIIPEHPPYYDQEAMSDKPMRFFVGEIVREKILQRYDKEVPYSCEVVIDGYKEDDEVIEIECTIFVARDSQKGIIVGKQGAKIKSLGIDARRSLEKFLRKKVRLNTWVKVNKDWRDQDDQLKKYGYFD